MHSELVKTFLDGFMDHVLKSGKLCILIFK